jgi:hypothetical protein
MQTHLLVVVLAAAASVAAVPAAAQTYNFSPNVSSQANVLPHTAPASRTGEQWRGDRGVGGPERRGGHRRHRYGGNSFVYYGGAWALYNNRSFEPESYNDWWHERPYRSLPRWTQRNANCDRVWWSGEGWTC